MSKMRTEKKVPGAKMPKSDETWVASRRTRIWALTALLGLLLLLVVWASNWFPVDDGDPQGKERQQAKEEVSDKATNPAADSSNRPPVVQATASRDGVLVRVEGSIADEFPATVNLLVESDGQSNPIPVIDGEFAVNLEVDFAIDYLVLSATEESGQKIRKYVEIAF